MTSTPLSLPNILTLFLLLTYKRVKSWKRRQKEFKSQRKWRTPRIQGPLNQPDQSSCELTENAAASSGPTQVCTRSFVYILCLPDLCFHGTSESTQFWAPVSVPSLGIFSFFWFVLSNFDVKVLSPNFLKVTLWWPWPQTTENHGCS